MHSQCNTKIEINKVEIEFTDKKMTSYGGFSLLAAFFDPTFANTYQRRAQLAVIPMETALVVYYLTFLKVKPSWLSSTDWLSDRVHSCR